MTKTSEDQIRKILSLHQDGLKNREIARYLGISHRCVGYYIGLNGRRANGAVGCKLDKVDDYNARCTRCKNIYPLKDWPIARDNKKYPYRLSYCRHCRKKQMYDRLNKNSESFMGDRFNKVKRRAKVEKVPFNLTKEFLINLYNYQKGLCFYTGEILHLTNGKGRLPSGLSIDRIDNSKGYNIDNVVLCTSRFNTIKNNMTLEEIKNWMPSMYEKIEMWKRRGIFVFDCNQSGEDF